MSKLLVIFILSIVLFKSILCSGNADLLSVIVIYRHGARAPTATFQKDIHKDTSVWGADLGHMNNIGLMQLYELGKWLRDRYDGFLPTSYSHRDIEVFSSYKDRCFMSAAACLAGLYPPEGEQIWNNDLLWRPIPIQMIPASNDAILQYKKRCAKRDRLYKEEMKKSHMQKILKENREFFKFVSEKTGEDIMSLEQMKDVCNIFLTQSYYNVSIPGWVKDNFKKMECLAIIEATSRTATIELARLKSGPLIDIIISHFENTIKNKTIPKFLMYSAHDTTLIRTMHSMQIFDYQWPDFASMLIFELRKDDGKHLVNMLYKNSAGLTQLTLKGSRFDCEIEKFKQILAPIRISLRDWVRECFE